VRGEVPPRAGAGAGVVGVRVPRPWRVERPDPGELPAGGVPAHTDGGRGCDLLIGRAAGVGSLPGVALALLAPPRAIPGDPFGVAKSTIPTGNGSPPPHPHRGVPHGPSA